LTRLTVLAGVSEPGGAKNIALVAKEFGQKAVFKIFSSKGATQILQRTGLAFEQADQIEQLSEARELLYVIRPTVILTGRGIQPNSLERLLVRAARDIGIPSVGLIDEWYDYRANYSDKTGSWDSLPNIICCPDEQARREAAGEGLPTEGLLVTGSPALAAVFDRREKYRAFPPSRPSMLPPEGSGPMLVFLSEVIQSNPDATSPDTGARLGGNSPGYNEYSVRQDLRNILESTFEAVTVIEKLHPSADPGNYPAIKSSSVDWRTVLDADLELLCWWADMVVGMRSAALIDARLLGTSTVSFQPGLVGENRCTAVRKGMVPCFLSRNSFQTWLQDRACSPEKDFIGRPEFAFLRSTQNVFSALTQVTVGF